MRTLGAALWLWQLAHTALLFNLPHLEQTAYVEGQISGWKPEPIDQKMPPKGKLGEHSDLTGAWQNQNVELGLWKMYSNGQSDRYFVELRATTSHTVRTPYALSRTATLVDGTLYFDSPVLGPWSSIYDRLYLVNLGGQGLLHPLGIEMVFPKGPFRDQIQESTRILFWTFQRFSMNPNDTNLSLEVFEQLKTLRRKLN